MSFVLTSITTTIDCTIQPCGKGKRVILKNKIDTIGSVSLISFSALLGINQVLIKITNEGVDPIFSAGARSLVGIFFLGLWMIVFNKPLDLKRGTFLLGLLTGIVFSLEFFLLYLALDLTTVIRSSIIFYSMPVWLAVISHFWFPNDKLTKIKCTGLILSLSGIVWAITNSTNSASSGFIMGDLCALGASALWALIAIISKGTRFSCLNAETQLLWMLAVSFPILMIMSLMSQEILRDFKYYHAYIIVFQGSVVVAAGFALWFWLLSIYPASGVASFAFLAPVFGILFDILILQEPVDINFGIGATLVIFGIFLVNYNHKKL